ncbi:MAG: FimV/HubP family polar landmark protein [Woeseiaceae bacterium]|nr:FimV/HubP family polar landmark protein [Woeseiaceae bacterium]
MPLRLMRISLAFILVFSSEVWAIGLGDINLDSALNEPLRAEIQLLSATPEELESLDVALASAETFDRYGIDRPAFLQDLQFDILSTSPNGPVVQIRSRSPIAEPFLTFLVEANWPSGRLLREYTVLLDPPTYTPPAAQRPQQVEAPRRAAPTDSARIERQPEPEQQQQQRATPPAQPRVTPPPSPARETTPRPAADDTPYSTTSSGDVYVERGATLWGIAARMRPDSRLTMNQTMLAIFEANPQAFDGNINRLKAGVSLRIPSADEIFRIDRSSALNEARRQNNEWSGTTTDFTPAEPEYTYEPEPIPEEPAEEPPSLVLVPPDEEPAGVDIGDDLETTEPLTREQEIEERIAELETADVADQPSLIEIRDSELAELRQELANIRGEIYEPPVDEMADEIVDDIFVDDSAEGVDETLPDADELVADDAEVADEAADETAVEDAAPPADIVSTRDEPGLVDQILGFLTSFWMWIVGVILAVVGLLVWFARRGGGDDADDMRPWESLDDDEMGAATGAAADLTTTETMHAPTPEEAFVVVEQDTGIRELEDTIESPAVEEKPADFSMETSETGEFGSLEDTFSSDTAVNLDQTDPIAEADFHMAYGLYDQAADLINGALETDPADKALMSKLCEIYFVWGNRDAFIDAASRLKDAVGGGDSAEWDKIVIMGQQIAADHALFAGAGVAGATKAVDLSFESDMDEAAELDMDFGGDAVEGESDIVDLGATEETVGGDVDFLFDDATAETGETAEMPTPEADADDTVEETAEMPIASETTVESPTIEEPFASDATSELPSLDESLGAGISAGGLDTEATAEINLDELDLDITGSNEALDDTGVNEALEDTGVNEEVDPNATGVQPAFDADASSIVEGLDLDDFSETGMRLAADETGRMPLSDVEEETDTSIDVDIDLLEATGRTQILSEDMAVDTQSDVDAAIGDDAETMLASLDETSEISSDAETMLASLDDDEDFDFAKTEALPPEAFSGGSDETGELPGVAETDVDLDLDDLTAALAVSEVGDTVEQLRDDATVEQPRPSVEGETAEIPTMSLAPEEMTDDLHEARTMTEVGTKLDLARAYVDMGDPAGARSILEEVLDEGDDSQRQQAQQLLDSLPG